MSYTTYSIIVKADTDRAELEAALSENFKFYNVRSVFTPFEGVVCQLSKRFKDVSFERFPGNFFTSLDEVSSYFNQMEEKLVALSKQYSNHPFAFVAVDCYGGLCGSEGYVIKNGSKIFEQEEHHSGHMAILKQLDSAYNTWFYHPFTRYFFSSMGGINGEVINFTIPALTMAFHMELKDESSFEINATNNELFVADPKRFDVYLMQLADGRVKVMGSLYDDSRETIDYLTNLLDEVFIGITFYIEIDDFKTGAKYTVANTGKEAFDRLAAISYRATAFNTRTLSFDDTATASDNDANDKTTSQNNTAPPRKEGFFDKIVRKIFGSV